MAAPIVAENEVNLESQAEKEVSKYGTALQFIMGLHSR